MWANVRTPCGSIHSAAGARGPAPYDEHVQGVFGAGERQLVEVLLPGWHLHEASHVLADNITHQLQGYMKPSPQARKVLLYWQAPTSSRRSRLAVSCGASFFSFKNAEMAAAPAPALIRTSPPFTMLRNLTMPH